MKKILILISLLFLFSCTEKDIENAINQTSTQQKLIGQWRAFAQNGDPLYVNYKGEDVIQFISFDGTELFTDLRFLPEDQVRIKDSNWDYHYLNIRFIDSKTVDICEATQFGDCTRYYYYSEAF